MASAKRLKGRRAGGAQKPAPSTPASWTNPLCDYNLAVPFTVHGRLFMVPTHKEPEAEKLWKSFDWESELCIVADSLLSKGVKLSLACPPSMVADAVATLCSILKSKLCARYDREAERLVLWGADSGSAMDEAVAEYEGKE